MRFADQKIETKIAFASFASLAVCMVTFAISGCARSRSQHRIDADTEAYCTIAERNHDPRWAAQDIGIDQDERSRYFDPYSPDCPPMPRDDPSSHRYMHCVDGKTGWKHWHDFGTRADLENPDWRVRLVEYTDTTEEGKVKLNVDSAVRLAFVHAPLHQRSLETLYLSSLDVTGERFRLDTQFFGGNVIDYSHSGDLAPATIAFVPAAGGYVVTGPFTVPDSNRMIVASDLQARRRLATAGEVLVGFANSFAFEFAGGDVSLANSIANFSFIQPLLRGAGRDVALEQLTLSERRLLANLRAYSQFRQGFYTQIAIGELGVEAPQRGGFDTTLQSFSGVGGVGGYLGLLQQAQQIRNTQDNLRLQLRTRDRLEALYDNDLIDIVQLDQFRQNIEATRANLLDQTNGLELATDNYLTLILGLPSDLPVDVDTELVKGFQLIPIESNPILESLLALQKRIGDIGGLVDLSAEIELTETGLTNLPLGEIDEVETTLRKLIRIVEAVGIRADEVPADLMELEKSNVASSSALSNDVLRLQEHDGDLTDYLEEAVSRISEITRDLDDENLKSVVRENSDWLANILDLCRSVVVIQSEARNIAAEPDVVIENAKEFVEPVRELFESAKNDLEQMEAVSENRERLMDDLEKARYQRDRKALHDRLDELENGGDGFKAVVNELGMLSESYAAETRVETIDGLTAWIQSYLQIVERLALIPAQARLETITVDEVDLEAETAFQIALAHRLDFMNGRAALVDRWRAIQVAADALQSILTITADGDVRTARNNPADFRAATSRLRLGVEFDAPLARLLERNGYRETLINYQRSRRSLIQSHDALQKGLRALLRTLKQRRLQLEIQRRAVAIALRRVDQTQLSLLSPPPQGQPGLRPQINPTTAINLLGAQSSLQSSQNSFLAAWLNYYAARLRLYRELGVMQLEPSGHWIENALEFGSLDLGVESAPENREAIPPPVPNGVLEAPNDAVGEPNGHLNPDFLNQPVGIGAYFDGTRNGRDLAGSPLSVMPELVVATSNDDRPVDARSPQNRVNLASEAKEHQKK